MRALQLLLENEGARVARPVGQVAVAEALLAWGVRFAFMSGYGRSILPEKSGRDLLPKAGRPGCAPDGVRGS